MVMEIKDSVFLRYYERHFDFSLLVKLIGAHREVKGSDGELPLSVSSVKLKLILLFTGCSWQGATWSQGIKSILAFIDHFSYHKYFPISNIFLKYCLLNWKCNC